jgi:hypothetical protein
MEGEARVTSLKRIRWGVRGVLGLGVAASVIANVLHAVDNPISQSIAAWPPLALLLTVELISRIPVHSRALAVARIVATAAIAGIAAWVSYWHMAGVAARYGETGASPYLLPISVDGLIVVASICLVELAGRIRAAEEGATDGTDQEHLRTAGIAAGEESTRPEGVGLQGPDRPGRGQGEGGREGPADPDRQDEVATPEEPKLSRPRKPHTTNPQRITQAHKRHPDATHEELAKRLNLSPSTVKKYRPTGSPSTPPPAATRINGSVPDLEDVNL